MAVVLWQDRGANGPMGQMGGMARAGASKVDAAMSVLKAMMFTSARCWGGSERSC